MKRFAAETSIDAPPEAVWRVLADVASWAEWDPATDAAEGVVEKGGQLTFRSSQAPGQALKVSLTAVDEPYLLEWTGGVAKAFTTLRTHRVIPDGDQASKVEVSEEISGALLPMIEKQIPDIDALLDEFVGGLKKRVETGSA
jgi:uncharacterized protein YndB with AHSA1/START domain